MAIRIGDTVYFYTNTAAHQTSVGAGPYAGYVTHVHDQDTLDLLQVISGTGTENSHSYPMCKRKGKHAEPWTSFWTERA